MAHRVVDGVVDPLPEIWEEALEALKFLIQQLDEEEEAKKG